MSVSLNHVLGRGAHQMFAVALATFTILTQPAVASETGLIVPVGFQIFCLKNPEQCKGGGANAIQVGQNTLRELSRVNRSVNQAIRPIADGRRDQWSVNVSSGDCEDYVLAKRQALLLKGYPSSALRIAYVKTRSGEGHAVLVVRTDQGDYALDNLNNSLRELRSTGYQVVSMSGANPLKWN